MTLWSYSSVWPEHPLDKRKVRGSNPFATTTFFGKRFLLVEGSCGSGIAGGACSMAV